MDHEELETGKSQMFFSSGSGQPIFRTETLSTANNHRNHHPILSQIKPSPPQFQKIQQAIPQQPQQPLIQPKVETQPAVKKKRNVPTPAFLTKCYDIFSREDHAGICGWGAKGDTIIVHQPHRFAVEILPKYFKHANFQSFVRQLNMYNFTKTNPDPLIIEFKQIYFRRGRHDLLPLIKRRSPAQGGLVAALARARKGATQFDHPPPFELPRVPPEGQDFGSRAGLAVSSSQPLDTKSDPDQIAPTSTESSDSPIRPGGGASGGPDPTATAPPLATLSHALLTGAQQELSHQSDALLHDLVHLLRWQKRMERRVQQLESETKSLHGENVMLWNMANQRAEQQDGMTNKMRDILLLMHRAFQAGEAAVQKKAAQNQATPPQPGSAITKTASELISEMSQIDFERNVKELGIAVPALVTTKATNAKDEAPSQASGKRKDGGEGQILASEPKRHCTSATAPNEVQPSQPDPKAKTEVPIDKYLLSRNAEEEKEQLIDSYFQMANAEEQTLGKLNSLESGLEHLLSFDQADLANLLRSESTDNPAEVLERYASIDSYKKEWKPDQQPSQLPGNMNI